MKRLIAVFIVLFMCTAANAQVKVTALTEDLTPTTDDLMITVNNPTGTAATRKATLGALRTLMLAGDGSNLTGLLQSQVTGTMAESNLTFTDITTNDVSTTKHGFAPKGNNDNTYYLDGQGNWTVPSAAAAGGWTDVGTSVYTTTSTDKVGIGVSNPAEALAVVGNVTVTGTLNASGVITGGSFSGNASTATLATTAVALQANGANCAAGQAPLGVNASGAVEGCYAILSQAAIDTSAELRAILTDETGTGVAVFNTAPTFSGLVTAGSFAGDGSALTGLATSFTNSSGLAALMNDETGTGLSVFATAPTFTNYIVLPSAAVPVVDATAELAFDNNLYAASHGAPVLYDGASAIALVGALVQTPPTNGQVPKYETGGWIRWSDDNDTSGITVANTQVVFADGANSPAGDSGFTYNKTTNAVTADSFITTASASPSLTFKDSDATAGDTNAQVVVACTDTGDGSEDCDVTFSQQIAGVMTAFITADADGNVTVNNFSIGADSIDGDDLAASLAGRSLTETAGSPDVIDADAELYTHTKCATIETPTSSDNFIIHHVELGAQVTAAHCIVEDATSATIEFEQCDVAGDNCTVITTAIVCDVDGQADDGVIDNPDLDVDDWIRMDVTATSGTPAHVTGCISFQMDD